MSHTRDWRANFDCMVGRTIVRIEGASSGSECITFTADNGDYFNLLHVQNCCESVSVEDICGDVEDLIGVPILMAEEAFEAGDESDYGSSTWTFYKLATIKGSVTIRAGSDRATATTVRRRASRSGKLTSRSSPNRNRNQFRSRSPSSQSSPLKNL